MTIRLDNLTESDLIDLNRKIIERLKFLRQSRAHEAMLEFRIGDRVTFNPEGRGAVTGMLTRYNKTTVTVITDDGQHWNVAPGFLKKYSDKDARPLKLAGPIPKTDGNVVPIKGK